MNQAVVIPSVDVLNKIADYFNVSVDYLLGRSNAPANPIDPFSFSNIQPVKKHRIPLLGEIACGEPIFADEDFEGFIESDIEADFALRCNGGQHDGRSDYGRGYSIDKKAGYGGKRANSGSYY